MGRAKKANMKRKYPAKKKYRKHMPRVYSESARYQRVRKALGDRHIESRGGVRGGAGVEVESKVDYVGMAEGIEEHIIDYMRGSGGNFSGGSEPVSHVTQDEAEDMFGFYRRGTLKSAIERYVGPDRQHVIEAIIDFFYKDKHRQYVKLVRKDSVTRNGHSQN